MLQLKSRRVAVGAVVVTALVAVAAGTAKTKPKPVAPLKTIDHFVVVYEENHSFDNLYGGWEGVNGLANADKAHSTQVNQAGVPFSCLIQDDVNLAARPASCTDTSTSTSFQSAFANGPFSIDGILPASATSCPNPVGAFAANGFLVGTGLPGGCTRDIVHRFYEEQFQIDGGKQDRYVAGSDAVGLTMGHYDTKSLPIYRYLHQQNHPAYAIEDRFFQGAFGGSFLNHQFLIADAAPLFANAPNDGSANDLHSVVDANGMPTSYPLYSSPLGTAVKNNQLTVSCNPPAGRPAAPANLACGDYAVNTTQPWVQPYAPGTADARRLPPLTNPTIGDRLSAKGIDWAWYSGGWSNADGDVGAPGWTNGSGPKCSDPQALSTAVYPNCPDVDFQFHHQPFNYYADFAPGTAARAAHLKDEAEFTNLAASSTRTCKLKPVSFVKPVGEENEHPGYASESVGSDHLVQLLRSIESSACAKDTMVIVTYDEFGGQWDHVSPPGTGTTTGPHDKWGPGTRIASLVVAPQSKLKGTAMVDSTEHDTESVLSTLEHRYGLAPLGTRDAAVPDLSSAFVTKKVAR